MILLDTNVLSAMMQVVPDGAVASWLDKQPRFSIWTTSITVMELRAGLHAMPPSRRRDMLNLALAAVLEEKIQGRIASFDVPAAEHAAVLVAERKSRGRLGEIRDTLIAGIALASRAVLATRNVSHFADLSVPVVNPWEA